MDLNNKAGIIMCSFLIQTNIDFLSLFLYVHNTWIYLPIDMTMEK